MSLINKLTVSASSIMLLLITVLPLKAEQRVFKTEQATITFNIEKADNIKQPEKTQKWYLGHYLGQMSSWCSCFANCKQTHQECKPDQYKLKITIANNYKDKAIENWNLQWISDNNEHSIEEAIIEEGESLEREYTVRSKILPETLDFSSYIPSEKVRLVERVFNTGQAMVVFKVKNIWPINNGQQSENQVNCLNGQSEYQVDCSIENMHSGYILYNWNLSWRLDTHSKIIEFWNAAKSQDPRCNDDIVSGLPYKLVWSGLSYNLNIAPNDKVMFGYHAISNILSFSPEQVMPSEIEFSTSDSSAYNN